MSWQTLQFACGHSAEQQLYGPHHERDRHAEAAKNRLCPECYQAQTTQRQAQQSEQARLFAAQSNLPALSGSEKQVAWAESIRAKAIESIDHLVIPAEKQASIAPLIAWLRMQTEAKFWIDHRDNKIAQEWILLAHRATMSQPA